jgi:hypothetical protein
MEGFYLALGVTVVLPFAQWLAPTMPRLIAYTGMAGGVLIMLAEFLDPSMKPPFSVVILFLIGALCMGGAAHLYLKAIRSQKAPEKTADLVPAPAPVTPPAVSRSPTLEATNRSVIDATGGQFPADMPFPFAKADNDSFVNMPGVTVTKNPDGTMTVSTAPVNQQFPPPTGEYTKLSKKALRAEISKTSSALRLFDNERSEASQVLLAKYADSDFSKNQHPAGYDDDWKALHKRFQLRTDQLAKLAQSLASECMARIGSLEVSTLSTAARMGAGGVLNAKFAGPHPAFEAAEFLDELSRRLN